MGLYTALLIFVFMLAIALFTSQASFQHRARRLEEGLAHLRHLQEALEHETQLQLAVRAEADRPRQLPEASCGVLDRDAELHRWNYPDLHDRPSRTCRRCGHVHPWSTPIYRCEACQAWGQDFYELGPPGHDGGGAALEHTPDTGAHVHESVAF